MKLKLDENLPLHLAAALEELGHDVHTVKDENLTGCSGRAHLGAAQREARFLITQDLDFSDTRQFMPGSHQGILLVRLRTPSRRNLIERIERIFQSEAVEEWSGCFVVASDRKIRVQKP